VTLWKRTGGSLTTTTGTSVVTGIYDSGTNSFGSWIRFTDGTMICRGYFTPSATSGSATFPQNFILSTLGEVSVSGSFVPTISNSTGLNIWAQTASQLNYYCFDTGVPSHNPIAWQAIGKWK
jgi:hypothetical protein